MPYYRNKDINLLYIHIPKTGGTTIEEYFSKKYNIPLRNESLYKRIYEYTPLEKKYYKKCSLHHYTYNDIIEQKDILDVNTKDIKIVSSVRNPYKKIISDLFFFKMISKDSTPEFVFTKIQHFIKQNPDNHSTPQYKFITNKDGKLIKNIKIVKCENLKEDMIKIGYNDFDDKKLNKNHIGINSNDYIKYLNKNSINLINILYHKDFKLFKYSKMNI